MLKGEYNKALYELHMFWFRDNINIKGLSCYTAFTNDFLLERIMMNEMFNFDAP
jgi:hypothetical protein